MNNGKRAIIFIKDFLQAAFGHVGLDWEKWVEVDPTLIRTVDVGRLVGDYAKAREKLGWKPEVTFEELVRMMVDSQLQKIEVA